MKMYAVYFLRAKVNSRLICRDQGHLIGAVKCVAIDSPVMGPLVKNMLWDCQ